MGEQADYMLNGDDCQFCGVHIGTGKGYPRPCSDCKTGKETRKSTLQKLRREFARPKRRGAR